MTDRRRRARSMAAYGLVALGHLAILAALGLGFRRDMAPREADAIQLTLSPPARAKPSRDRNRPEPARERPAPRLPLSPPPGAAAPFPPAVSADALDAAVRPGPGPAVVWPRGLGCAARDLGAEERRRCDGERWADRGSIGPALEIRNAKTAAWDAELARRRAPPIDPYIPCPTSMHGSNLGVACLNSPKHAPPQ